MNAYSGRIFCPGGETSQTGVAVRERYPEGQINSCGERIPDARQMLETEPGPYVIPIWNSHQGQIEAAMFIWECIENDGIKVVDFWAKRIEFWWVRRKGEPTSHKKIGSVVVARSQCSGFLRETQFELAECALTTTAFFEYKAGAEWDGVLIAPGQGDEDGFEIVSKKNANPNNFTSFLRYISSRNIEPGSVIGESQLTGVRMPSFGATLGDAEGEFFDRMLKSIKAFHEMPRLIFVFNQNAHVGLLFEGGAFSAGDFLDAEQIETGNVAVYENAGTLEKLYTTELRDLFTSEFPELTKKDFILHRGVRACLFACPPLGLYTHGYAAESVEPVFRLYVSRLFQLWYDEAVQFSEDQQVFFRKYEELWLEHQSEFMEFESVNSEH